MKLIIIYLKIFIYCLFTPAAIFATSSPDQLQYFTNSLYHLPIYSHLNNSYSASYLGPARSLKLPAMLPHLYVLTK